MTNQNAYEPLKQPLQARSRATVEAILEAAAQLLPEHGYAGTTTNRIAERAGVSIGSVYEYFPGKDAIFATLRQNIDRHTFDFVTAKLQDASIQSPRELLRRLLEARVEVALEQPKLEALLRAEIPASVIAEQAENSYAVFLEGLRAFANAHAEALRIENLDAALHLGIHAVDLTVTHLAAAQPERLRDPALVAELVDMMTRWILKD
jgi:AcrR family transcriptional regulator